jgi:uncharacterized FlgJ-related protein
LPDAKTNHKTIFGVPSAEWLRSGWPYTTTLSPKRKRINMNVFSKTESCMSGIAAALDKTLEEIAGKKMGFALIVFEFNEKSLANYVSNANRSQMISELRQAANQLEKGKDIPATIGEA